MDMPTRESRRVFLALREFSPVHTRMRSPSRSTQTGATWGEPSGMRVARWAKLAPRTKALTSSESAMPFTRRRPSPRAFRRQNDEAALTQVRVHVRVLTPVALPPLLGGGAAALPPLAHAPIHDDAHT